jgi:Holliday junction DNA helicase RuvB
MLTAPLRERFGIRLHFDFYEVEDLTRIVQRSAAILGVPIEPEGAWEIARRSRGTPRIANRYLRRAQSFAEVKGDGRITRELADEALRLLRVDEIGLDKLDHSLLKTIIEVYNGGPVGIEALAATLNEDVDTLIDMVEPFLLKIGFLARTQAGRRATPAAYAHLGYAPPPHNKGAITPQLKLE